MTENITRIESRNKFKSTSTLSVVAFFAWTLSVYDYILFGDLLPVMGSQFGWDSATETLLSTLVSVGVLIVSLVVGPITDRVGRVKAMAITSGGVAASTFFAGFAGFLIASTAFVFLAFVRSFSGFGYSEQAVNATYLSEVYSEKNRGKLYSLVQGGWPIGVLLGSAFILLLLGRGGIQWYDLFWLATAPALIISLIALFFMPESDRYKHITKVRQLIKEGKNKEADELRSKYDVDVSELKKMTYNQLFDKKLRKHTLFLSLGFLTNWMGIQVFVVLITVVLTVSKGLSFSGALIWVVIANAASYVGYVVHGIIGDKIGRRNTIIIGWIIAGLAATGMMVAPPTSPLIFEILYVITLFFIIGPYSALLAYMGESFPTRARATGASFVNAMGPVGGIAGAGLLTLLLAGGISMEVSAIVAGGIPTIISGILLLGARNVKPGLKLEEIAI